MRGWRVTHTHTHSLLEGISFINGQSVGLGDDRNNVDTVMETLHELHIKWTQATIATANQNRVRG